MDGGIVAPERALLSGHPEHDFEVLVLIAELLEMPETPRTYRSSFTVMVSERSCGAEASE